MRLSRAFQATGGRTVPHVDGVAIPAFVGRVAGSEAGCWFNGQPLNQVQVTPTVWNLVTADGQVVSREGANHLFGNGSMWAADLDGYRDSRDHRQPDWVPVAIDDTTDRVAVSVKSDNSLQVWDGAVLLMVEPTGPDRWETQDIDFKDGILAYRKNGQVKTWPARNVVSVPAQGVRYSLGYVLEFQEGRGTIVRPEYSTLGIVVSAGDADFGADLRVLPDGQLLVVSSSGPSERPEEFKRRVINPVLAPKVDVSVLPTPAPVAIGRPCWLGWFEFSEPEIEQAPPSNSVLRITQGVPWNELRDLNGKVVARYTAGSPDRDVDSLDAAVKNAQGAGVPVIAYWTRQAQAVRVPKADVIGVEAYQQSGETDEAFEARIRASVARCERAVLIPQCYTSNTNNTPEISRIPAIVARIARDCPNVWGIVPFSGSGRATGYQDHPEVWEAWKALFRGITGVPVMKPAPTPQPIPAPTPAPAHEDDMPKTNPTDSITYAAVVAALAPREAGRNYTDGCLDAFRAIAEGTPLDKVAAGESHPTQAPVPHVEYPQWAAVALGLLAARHEAGKGIGYGDGVLDTYRRFGGERWPLEFILADIEGVKLPDRPWPNF